jgi:hypothetical protein
MGDRRLLLLPALGGAEGAAGLCPAWEEASRFIRLKCYCFREFTTSQITTFLGSTGESFGKDAATPDLGTSAR